MFDIISMWTTVFLEGIENCSHYRKEDVLHESLSKHGHKNNHTVVFGRNTHHTTVPVTKRNKPIEEHGTNARGPLNSKELQRNQNDNSKTITLSNCKHDRTIAREKRKRQMKYSLEVQKSRENAVSLQISSITRIVVQSFRKLIDCERCALFLMDHATNELCFKPVGNEHDSDPREIRFPASAGVAGWVATERQALNIQNAYQDDRFNPEIDKQTNYRTRTILCTPILSSTGHLVGVIQMVNKKKGNYRTITDNAKKKKSDAKHHGYESCFESFSEDDEETLHRCCVQVSRALEPFIAPNSTCESNVKSSNTASRVESVSCENKLNAFMASETHKGSDERCSSAAVKRRVTTVSIQNDVGLRQERRRSSVGSLVQFVNAETGKSHNGHTTTATAMEGMFGRDASVSEAIGRFQFRSAAGPQMSAKGQLRDDPDRILAASKRKRMTEYSIQRKDLNK